MPHWGEGLTSPQQVFPYAFRHVPLLARAHHLAHPRITEGALFTYLGPHTVLHDFPKFLWSPIRPANLSCVPCFPVTFARVPGVHGLDCQAVPAFQPSASRDRCFTSPQQAPCPVNLRSLRARGGTWRPYPRRCGDQARLTRLLWWQHSLRSTHNHNAFSWLCLATIPCAAKPPI